MELTWIISALVLLIGCTIQTAIGFGMSIVAAPIIVMIAPQWVPYVMAIMALFLSLSNAWHLRQDIQWSELVSPMIARIPGTVVGTWLLIIMPVMFLQIGIALMVFLTIVISLWAKPFAANPTNMGIAGFVSGITGTTTSIGGPPMALVMQHSKSNHTRANLAVYFVFSCIVSLIGYVLAGLFTWQLLWESISFLPCALVGFFLGKRLQTWVDSRFRPLLLTMCGISASVALISAIVNGTTSAS